MVLKLTVYVYVRNVISFFYKPKTLVYDVIVTPYVECLYLFWYVRKEETHSYTMVLIWRSWGFTFQVQREVVSAPLVNRVTKKAW